MPDNNTNLRATYVACGPGQVVRLHQTMLLTHVILLQVWPLGCFNTLFRLVRDIYTLYEPVCYRLTRQAHSCRLTGLGVAK
jgi:hypothetical protein